MRELIGLVIGSNRIWQFRSEAIILRRLSPSAFPQSIPKRSPHTLNRGSKGFVVKKRHIPLLFSKISLYWSATRPEWNLSFLQASC